MRVRSTEKSFISPPVSVLLMLLPALLLSIAAAAFLWKWHATKEIEKTDVALASARESMEGESSFHQRYASNDFVAHLPAAPKTAQLLQELQQSTKARGVRLTDVATMPAEATAQLLGRVTVSITLRGSYAAIKSVLADLAARNDSLLIQRLALQRSSVPTDLEAKVELMLLGRPLGMAGGTSGLASPMLEPSSGAASIAEGLER